MFNLRSLFKSKELPKTTVSIPSSVPLPITFEYTLNNSDITVMNRLRDGHLEPIPCVEPFTELKDIKIGDVERIYTGPENTEITTRNVRAYIEEPCIPIFLFLQNLGIQTKSSSANQYDTYASIGIKIKTLSEENMAIANANDLYHSYMITLSFPIEKDDTAKTISDKFMALGSVFVKQPVLYGYQSQAEHLASYSTYNGEYIAKISNIDANYITDHMKYLLAKFPEYITFDGEHYTCTNMPDELFQKEVLDRELICRVFYSEPHICVDGVVWDSPELYNINKCNTKEHLDNTGTNVIFDENGQSNNYDSEVTHYGISR